MDSIVTDRDAKRLDAFRLKFKPDFGQIYWYPSSISDTESVWWKVWENDDIDRFFYGTGRTFRTREDALAWILEFMPIILNVDKEEP